MLPNTAVTFGDSNHKQWTQSRSIFSPDVNLMTHGIGQQQWGLQNTKPTSTPQYGLGMLLNPILPVSFSL